MTDIYVSEVRKAYGDRQILKGLTFEVFAGEHVGFLGKNGAGKTTLFRIISGELTADTGGVALPADKRVGVLSQMPVYPAHYTVDMALDGAFSRLHAIRAEMVALERAMQDDHAKSTLDRYGALSVQYESSGGYDMAYNTDRVCNGLEIAAGLRSKLISSCSGGEQTRLNLARLILQDTDILLLDEPTNHLDIHAVEWLEDYLRTYAGTVLAVSHDRYFLDVVVKRVVELIDGKADFYHGNYSFYVAEKAARYEAQLEKYEREQAESARILETARKLHEHGTKKMHIRAFSMEKRAARIAQTDKPGRERALNARFDGERTRADEALRLERLAKGYGGRELFRELNAAVVPEERIAVIGDNGTGKTTLMRIIAGELDPDEGSVWAGPSVQPAYMPQIVEFDHPERTLIDTLLYELDCSTQRARDLLGRFKFSGEDAFKYVGDLSGGERSRLKLCLLMAGEVNMLLLDEPTNHLDIASREWIERAVDEYPGTLLFISHDRYFINRFATRIWELEDGTLTDYPCGYAEYRALKAKADAQPETRPAKPAREQEAPPTKKEVRSQRNSEREKKKRIESLERNIESAESHILRLQGEMEEAGADYLRVADLMDEKTALDTELTRMYEQWRQLVEDTDE